MIFLFQNGCNYNKTKFLVEFKINKNSSYLNIKPNGCIFVNRLRRTKSTVITTVNITITVPWCQFSVNYAHPKILCLHTGLYIF